MLLNYKNEQKKKEIEKVLIEKGYSIITKELIVFGGKNNGTMDIKATSQDGERSIIIEIKSNPLFAMDIAHFYDLKQKLEKTKDGSYEKVKYYIILLEEKEVVQELKDFAKTKNIMIINCSEFLQLEEF